MKALAAALLILLLTAGPAAARARRDVQGVVKRGPTSPTCSPGSPCTAPAAGVTVEAFGSGKLVAQTTTSHKGHFAFSLSSGSYTIEAVGRGTKPQVIHAARSHVIHLSFLIDTGIR